MRKTFLKTLGLFLLLFYFLLVNKAAYAKKQIGSGKITTSVKSTSIIIYPRLRKDRRALLVTFSNLGVVSSFSYELTYLSNGIDQGVFGTVTPSGESSTSRELLFGTCSHNVCRYHSGVQNMRLTVTTNLKNGQKVTKRYRVKP